MICMEEAGMKKELFKTVLSLVGIFLWIYICQIIPRHYDLSGTLGVLAFSCIVSSVLGGTLLFMKVIENIGRVISLCFGN